MKNGFDGTLAEFVESIRGLALEFRTNDTVIQWHYEGTEACYGSYFSDNASRIAPATDYAVASGLSTYDSAGYWWWLRSPRRNYDDRAHRVGSDGSDCDNGDDRADYAFGVRPALWLNPES